HRAGHGAVDQSIHRPGPRRTHVGDPHRPAWPDGAHRAVARRKRARSAMSQPFSVAQVFTGRAGKQVPVAETVRGFKEILEGKHDAVPEGDFYMKGGIDEVKPA